MNKPVFILASASPRRLTLLRDIGITPDRIEPSDIDETPFRGEKPRDLAVRLAHDKGALIAARSPGSLVLSADTVVACGRRVLPKAESAEDVADCLRLLSGRRHHVFTAVALFLPAGGVLRQLSDSVVTFKRLTADDIASYAASAEGQGKAGGYAIQGRAATLIRQMAGSYSGIVGLPLYEVRHLLNRAGYP